MRHTVLKCSALAYYAIFAAAIGLSGIYLTSAVTMFSAFAAHREFETLSKLTENPANSPKLRQWLDAALARHPAHGKYYAARATLIAESPENSAEQIDADLQEAIRRDPANADYYYEAGRITAARQICAPSAALSPDNAGESCVTARYIFQPRCATRQTTCFSERRSRHGSIIIIMNSRRGRCGSFWRVIARSF